MNTKKDFYILMAGRFISGAGSFFNMVALNLFILIKTGSPTVTGLAMAARIFAACAASPFLGSLADRIDRKKGMMASDLILGLVMLMIAFLPEGDYFVAAIFLVQIALGVFQNFFMINFQAALPVLAPNGDLLRANSLFQLVNCGTILLGSAGAAALISKVGYHGAFAIDGISYLVSMFILFFLPLRTQERREKRTVLEANDGFMNGVRFLVRTAPFIFLVFFIRLLDGVGSGSHNVAMPVFSEMVDPHAPNRVYGSILAAWGAGSFLSVLWMARSEMAKGLKHEKFFMYSTVLMSVFWIITFQAVEPFSYLFAAFLAGIFDTSATVSFSMIIQRTDDFVRGRVMALSAITMTAGFGGGMAAASVMAGFMPAPMLVLFWHGIPVLTVMGIILYQRAIRPVDELA